MTNEEIESSIRELRQQIDALMRALALLRISIGHTGNQWFTIPPAPQKGESNDKGTGRPPDSLPSV